MAWWWYRIWSLDPQGSQIVARGVFDGAEQEGAERGQHIAGALGEAGQGGRAGRGTGAHAQEHQDHREAGAGDCQQAGP